MKCQNETVTVELKNGTLNRFPFGSLCEWTGAYGNGYRGMELNVCFRADLQTLSGLSTQDNAI